jgi:hypothetical protein
MGTAFDEVARIQRKKRDEADSYRFFINAGFVPDIEERKKLYLWFSDDWEIKDPEGYTRIRLLRKLPDHALWEIIDMDRLHKQPDRLQFYIKNRICIDSEQ